MMQEVAGAEAEMLTVDKLYESVKQHFKAEAEQILPPREVFPDGVIDGIIIKPKIEQQSLFQERSAAAAESKESDDSSTSSGNIMPNSTDITSQSVSSTDSILTVQKSEPTSRPASAAAAAVGMPMLNADIIDDLDDVSMFTAEELRKLYPSKPPKLFCTPEQEPMRSGIQQLTELEIRLLEDRYQCRLPHKSLLHAATSDKFTKCLDLVESLWTVQALKERHFESWFYDLRQLHDKEVCR
jgi:hypothetical protein